MAKFVQSCVESLFIQQETNTVDTLWCTFLSSMLLAEYCMCMAEISPHSSAQKDNKTILCVDSRRGEVVVYREKTFRSRH